jgi:thioredoxin-dependent peroxiredoxin
MTLTESIKAPVFKIRDVYGRIIDLESFRNKKILIGFFRHAGCPFCNLRVHALSKIQADLKSKGLEMIFFFESKESVILRSTFHQGISPIPIISDPEKIWYRAYGLESSLLKSTVSHLTSFVKTAWKAQSAKVPLHMMASGESFSTMPAEFLVDENLVIRKVHYSDRLNDRMELTEITRFVNP